LVNPYDSRAVGHAIQAALSMSLTERRERHGAMLQVLRRNDIASWTRRFIEALQESQRESSTEQVQAASEPPLRVVRSGLHSYRA
jgi:trehalose 6-phosphate synthase